jgi:hypothetical protein
VTIDDIVHAYTVEQRSTTELGRMLGVSPSWITERLQRAGVERRRAGTMTHAQRARMGDKTAYRPPNENQDHEFVRRIVAEGGYYNAYIRGMSR